MAYAYNPAHDQGQPELHKGDLVLKQNKTPRTNQKEHMVSATDSLSFFLSSATDWTHGLVHAKQMLYHWAPPVSLTVYLTKSHHHSRSKGNIIPTLQALYVAQKWKHQSLHSSYQAEGEGDLGSWAVPSSGPPKLYSAFDRRSYPLHHVVLQTWQPIELSSCPRKVKSLRKNSIFLSYRAEGL